MPKIPPLDPQKLIKVLENFSFRVVRQKGSHVIMMNEKKTISRVVLKAQRFADKILKVLRF